MRRFVLAAVLALVFGSQADAQLFRRYAAPAYYYPGSNVVVASSAYTYTPNVVTAGYYTAPTTAWNYGSYSPGYGYSSYGSSYYNPGYSYANTYAYPRYGRRWRGW